MTPAPFMPVILGHTAHSREAGHALPSAESSRRIRCSLSAATSLPSSRAAHGKTNGTAALVHLPAPSAEEGERQQGLDSTPFRAGPGCPGRLAPTYAIGGLAAAHAAGIGAAAVHPVRACRAIQAGGGTGPAGLGYRGRADRGHDRDDAAVQSSLRSCA